MSNKSFTSKQIKESIVLQQDQSDCGVACLLSLIELHGGSQSLERLRELSGTTKQGTTLLGLYQAANSLGFTAEGNEADIKALIEHGQPVILHVIIDNRLQHYVVCYGFENNQFIIGDPAKGIVHYSAEELEQIWESKTCLTLEPNSNFVYEKENKAQKWNWFKNILKEDTNLLIISAIFGVFVAILGMAMAVFSQKLIDDILPSKDSNKLIVGIVLVCILLLARVGFSALRDYILIRQSKDFNNRIIDRFYTALLHLPKSFFDTRKIGELVTRLNDTQRVQKVIQTVASNFIINVLVSIISLGFLFYYSWQIGVIALLSLPIYFGLIYSFNSKIITAQKEMMQGYAHSESHYINSMQGIATIKNENRQSIFQKLNQLIYGYYQDKVFSLGQIHVRLSLFSGIFSVLFLISILAFSSYRVYINKLELGQLMAILGIAGSMLPAVASLALIAIPINEAKVAFNRMYEFASIKPESTGIEEITSFKQLSLQNVSFRFAGRSQLLKNISFKITKGECVALVGESGSGKSTIAQLVQKFYEVETGKIIVNHQHLLSAISTESWRNIIGVIPQDITIFNGTLVDNIILGKEDTIENIVTFCKEYGFEQQFIQKLPNGYSTILGENGINLSGGQKQLLALMRTLYQNPQFLILDESTSAMDRNTEQFVLNLLNRLKSNMGILFVTHRLYSLPTVADKIVVVENGQNLKPKFHNELLQTNNFYSQFFKLIS